MNGMDKILQVNSEDMDVVIRPEGDAALNEHLRDTGLFSR